ncbi:MAG: GGDEF domain-containing protein [Betaproteobacteria bacterium]|nr:GGDEF domain-containing protein [Betaproteobacteria bacterium]
MSFQIERFPAPLEEQFLASRRVAQAEINLATYRPVAWLVLIFSAWDWYVDPVHWPVALLIRLIGVVIILLVGVIQQRSGRIDWAPMLTKIRYAAAVLAVAGALAVLDAGYMVGLAGLVAGLLAGAYIATDRRDLLRLNLLPLPAIGVILYCAQLDRFVIVNSAIFIILAMSVSMMLARVLEAANRRAFLLEQQLNREARTDALTGQYNRRALEEFAETELKRAARSGTRMSVILCDVDHFKRVNDQHGHDAGDRVIRAVAEQLRSVIRDTDALGRWGGEEFLVILPDTGAQDAAVLAERMRVVVETAAILVPDQIHVSISLGVAAHADHVLPGAWDRLLKAADGAMYRAKESGRNRVVSAGGSEG